MQKHAFVVVVVNQTLWIKNIMTNLHMEQGERTQMFVNNQTPISIANDPIFHGKTKHFKIRFFLLREVQRGGEVKLLYGKTEN